MRHPLGASKRLHNRAYSSLGICYTSNLDLRMKRRAELPQPPCILQAEAEISQTTAYE